MQGFVAVVGGAAAGPDYIEGFIEVHSEASTGIMFADYDPDLGAWQVASGILVWLAVLVAVCRLFYTENLGRKYYVKAQLFVLVAAWAYFVVDIEVFIASILLNPPFGEGVGFFGWPFRTLSYSVAAVVISLQFLFMRVVTRGKSASKTLE